MSAADGAASMILFHCQASEIAQRGTAGCNPCDALVDVTAGWLRSEEIKRVIGYAEVGAIAERPIDDGVPCSSSLLIGGPFAEVAGDPFGWLICKGCDPIAMPVTDLALQVQVLDEELVWTIIRPRRQSPGARFRRLVSHFSESLLEFFVGGGLGSSSCVDGGGFCCGAGEAGNEGRDTFGVLVGQMFAFVVAELGVGEVDGVRFTTSAHGDVDPFTVDAVAGNCVGTARCGALGFVSGDGVAPVEVTIVEVPVGHRDRLIGSIKTEDDGSPFCVDAGDGGEVAVEGADPGPGS